MREFNLTLALALDLYVYTYIHFSHSSDKLIMVALITIEFKGNSQKTIEQKYYKCVPSETLYNFHN